MEITSEIKAKVFAQYWNGEVGYFDGTIAFPPILQKHKVKYLNLNLDFTFEKYKLILKPLSIITDEDAKQISIVGLPTQNYIWCATSGKDLVNAINNKRCWSFYYKNADWFAIKQKLIDLGYDVFNSLIENKTLHEAGLAIYE